MPEWPTRARVGVTGPTRPAQRQPARAGLDPPPSPSTPLNLRNGLTEKKEDQEKEEEGGLRSPTVRKHQVMALGLKHSQ